MSKHVFAAMLGAAALAMPTAAAASDHGGGHDRQTAKHVAKGKAKKVTFVFKGTFTAPGTVQVRSGNAHVRKGGFVGQTVTFDLASAGVVVADTNADGKLDLTDVRDGDQVLVQARVVKGTKYVAPADGAEPIAARKLIDKTNAPAADGQPDAAE
jgi:hypothetical protein